MKHYLEFEKPVAALDRQIADIRDSDANGSKELANEVSRIEAKSSRLLSEIYGKLTPWQKTQVARHPERPHFKHYVAGLFDEFVPLAGDRAFADDQAIIGGFARKGDERLVVIGHEKGDDTHSRLKHNFGMGKPEGYRKAIRLMDLADRFGLPVLTLVDTSGAFPGVQAEERGQAEAIARATQKCLSLRVPMIACIVGEGGSGGAVALASAERVLMFEHAVYSVISPEGCASILWRTSDRADDAAQAMRITAADLASLGVIDRVVPEPVGGAHRDPDLAISNLGEAVFDELRQLKAMSAEERIRLRQEKFLNIGQ